MIEPSANAMLRRLRQEDGECEGKLGYTEKMYQKITLKTKPKT